MKHISGWREIQIDFYIASIPEIRHHYHFDGNGLGKDDLLSRAGGFRDEKRNERQEQ